MDIGPGENSEFKFKVYSLVAKIPEGYVMSYGQVAALCGSPGAARIVGGLAHFGPDDVPWQRVVRKDGFLANGFPGGGLELQKKLLQNEGIKNNNLDQIINFNSIIYWPPSVIK